MGMVVLRGWVLLEKYPYIVDFIIDAEDVEEIDYIADFVEILKIYDFIGRYTRNYCFSRFYVLKQYLKLAFF